MAKKIGCRMIMLGWLMQIWGEALQAHITPPRGPETFFATIPLTFFPLPPSLIFDTGVPAPIPLAQANSLAKRHPLSSSSTAPIGILFEQFYALLAPWLVGNKPSKEIMICKKNSAQVEFRDAGFMDRNLKKRASSGNQEKMVFSYTPPSMRKISPFLGVFEPHSLDRIGERQHDVIVCPLACVAHKKTDSSPSTRSTSSKPAVPMQRSALSRPSAGAGHSASLRPSGRPAAALSRGVAIEGARIPAPRPIVNPAAGAGGRGMVLRRALPSDSSASYAAFIREGGDVVRRAVQTEMEGLGLPFHEDEYLTTLQLHLSTFEASLEENLENIRRLYSAHQHRAAVIQLRYVDNHFTHFIALINRLVELARAIRASHYQDAAYDRIMEMGENLGRCVRIIVALYKSKGLEIHLPTLGK